MLKIKLSKTYIFVILITSLFAFIHYAVYFSLFVNILYDPILYSFPALFIFFHFLFNKNSDSNFIDIILLYIISLTTVYITSFCTIYFAGNNGFDRILEFIKPMNYFSVVLGIWFTFIFLFQKITAKFNRKNRNFSIITVIVIYVILAVSSYGYFRYDLRKYVMENQTKSRYIESYGNDRLNIDSAYIKVDKISSKARKELFEFLFQSDINRLTLPMRSYADENFVSSIFIYIKENGSLTFLNDLICSRLNRKEREYLYFLLFYNMLSQGYDYTNLLNVFDSAESIPELQEYIHKKCSRKEQLSLTTELLKNLINHHEFEMYAYLLLIDLYHQEGNIKEATKYYNTSVSLKIPEDLPEEEVQYIESSKEKIKEIYNPLLKEK